MILTGKINDINWYYSGEVVSAAPPATTAACGHGGHGGDEGPEGELRLASLVSRHKMKTIPPSSGKDPPP